MLCAAQWAIRGEAQNVLCFAELWHDMKFPEIISGGQTGAERTALNWAIRNGYRHGGWCPRGRTAEDGQIPGDYGLRQTASSAELECIEKNVTRSNATVVFTLSAKPGGRANLTVRIAQKQKKPWVHIHSRTRIPGLILVSLISSNRVARLNVSGSTAAEEPAIGNFVQQVLDQVAKLLLHDSEPLNYETRRNESTNNPSRHKPRRPQ